MQISAALLIELYGCGFRRNVARIFSTSSSSTHTLVSRGQTLSARASQRAEKVWPRETTHTQADHNINSRWQTCRRRMMGLCSGLWCWAVDVSMSAVLVPSPRRLIGVTDRRTDRIWFWGDNFRPKSPNLHDPYIAGPTKGHNTDLQVQNYIRAIACNYCNDCKVWYNTCKK